MVLYEFLHGITDIDSTMHSVALQIFVLTVVQMLLPAAHSRKLESEADAIGLELMARAGYDPRHCAGLWNRMARTPSLQTSLPEILSTHPSCEHRQEDMALLADKLLPVYDKSVMELQRLGRDVPDSDAKLLPHELSANMSWELLQDEDMKLGTADRANSLSSLLPTATKEQLSQFLREIKLF